MKQRTLSRRLTAALLALVMALSLTVTVTLTALSMPCASAEYVPAV